MNRKQVAAVLRRAAAGELLTEIAAELGVHRNTLYRLARKAKDQQA